MQAFENTRSAFNIVLNKYINYCELYKMMNNGSLDGATKFEDFYRSWTYACSEEEHSSVI